MATVSIRNVRKRFGTTEVLHGVSVEIEDGEFVILVGPSGCGKSTLLRMIAGLENISDGEIAIGGRVVNNVAPKERDIAMVFQNYALYPHMTVRDNMAFALSLARAPKAVVDEKVARAAQILGLAPYLNRYPRQLSGGQRQRVAMGRAIVRDPQVFLFDEPLSNLDAKLRVQMRAEIKELHQRLATTTVYVTHDQIEAMTMADKIVVMNGGNVEQIGAPLDLYDHPNNLFVAGFIGSPAMNFLKGQITSGDVPCRGRRRTAVARRQGERVGGQADALWRAAGTFPARRAGSAGHGACGGADRIGNPGDGGICRHADRLRVPRTRVGEARRDDPHHCQPGAGASVRCRQRPTGQLSSGSTALCSRQHATDRPPRARALNVPGDHPEHWRKRRMAEFTRRDSLKLGAMALGAASVPIIGARAQVDDVPTANVKPLDYKLEKGAALHVLRPAKFVDPDQKYWDINTKKYTQATGIEVKIDYLSWEEMRPQEAVTANTGAGPDIIIGFSSDPQIYASKIHDMTDLADYLGAKYGGWFKLAELYGKKWGSKRLDLDPGRRRRRTDGLSHILDQGGRVQRRPRRSRRLPEALSGAAKDRPSLRLLFGPRAGRRQRLCVLAAVDAWRLPGGREGQDRHRFKGDDRGDEIRHRAAEDDDPGHAVVERFRQQQGLRSQGRSA